MVIMTNIKSKALPITFPGSTGQLAGFVVPPRNITQGAHVPAIILTPGFSGLMDHGLWPYVEAFTAVGILCLLYDHAHFGASEGSPRYQVDPLCQVADYRCALDYLEERDDIDSDKLAIWGSSLSGGHVLSVAAQDPRVRCAVSHTPFVSGRSNIVRYRGEKGLASQQHVLQREKARLAEGLEPNYIRVATKGNRGRPLISDEQAWGFFSSVDGWHPKVTLLSLDWISQYAPSAFCPDIRPSTRVLMVLMEEDQVNHTALQKDAFEHIKAPKDLLTLPGGHFDIYDRQQEKAVSPTTQWLTAHL